MQYTVHICIRQFMMMNIYHTDLWPFEGTWWSAFRVRSKNQFAGNKRMIDSTLPET